MMKRCRRGTNRHWKQIIIRSLKWAEGGFVGSPHYDEKAKARDERRGHGKVPLETNDNSEADDDFDPETGEVNDNIASPEILEDNILHAMGLGLGARA